MLSFFRLFLSMSLLATVLIKFEEIKLTSGISCDSQILAARISFCVIEFGVVLHYSNNANQNAFLLLEGFSRHLVFSLFITVLFIIDKHVKTILTACQLEF